MNILNNCIKRLRKGFFIFSLGSASKRKNFIFKRSFFSINSFFFEENLLKKRYFQKDSFLNNVSVLRKRKVVSKKVIRNVFQFSWKTQKFTFSNFDQSKNFWGNAYVPYERFSRKFFKFKYNRFNF